MIYYNLNHAVSIARYEIFFDNSKIAHPFLFNRFSLIDSIHFPSLLHWQLELVEELDNLQDALTTFRKETDDGDELELHGFEVAALMNLVIADTTVEEACALIPSLSRLPEAAIDEILDLIKSTMLRIIS